jgi:hypothetical protein
MPEFAGPMIRRWELGNALRRIREERHMTIAEVTAAMKERYGSSFSTTKLSRMETARRGVIPRDVHDLCVLYEVSAQERERLLELAKSAREQDEWSADTDPRGYRRYIALEQVASSIIEYTVMYMPGLLQTQAYATFVENLQYQAVDFYSPMFDLPERADERASLRMKRQEVLEGPDPLHLHVVIDENALRRRLPEPQVMGAQLRHLLTQSEKPNIHIQVMPMQVGLYPGAESVHWSVLGFPAGDAHPPRTGYLEAIFGGRVVERETEVTRMVGVFEILTGIALDSAASRSLIERIIADCGY